MWKMCLKKIYEALRARGKSDGKSISAEVLSLLAEKRVTADELARRKS